MKRKLVLAGLALVAMVLGSCQQQGTTTTEEKQELSPKAGMWRGTISLNDSVNLPFNFKLSRLDSSYKVVIYNAEEEIEITDIKEAGDSLRIQMPVFANYIKVKMGSEALVGEYVKPDADDYRLPFKAVYGDSSRFEAKSAKCCDINKKWRVVMSPGTKEEDPAIAYFDQKGSRVTGTFITPYGDFRYLEGAISGDSLKLSTYDGGNLYYFEAVIKDGQMMEGLRYSGRSFMEPWIAFRDEDYELPDPDTLTYLKEGYEGLSFRYPDLSGDTLSDKDFEGQPMIVTIMGSWCPNCMDEASYLTELHRQYADEGLAIVGLTFERVKDRATAIKRAQKMKEDIGMPYPVLLAGATRQDRAGDALPMLNHVMSFPTTIYLNHQHEVVKIHTGFKGPGTPYYDDFVSRNRSFIEKEILTTKAKS